MKGTQVKNVCVKGYFMKIAKCYEEFIEVLDEIKIDAKLLKKFDESDKRKVYAAEYKIEKQINENNLLVVELEGWSLSQMIFSLTYFCHDRSLINNKVTVGLSELGQGQEIIGLISAINAAKAWARKKIKNLRLGDFSKIQKAFDAEKEKTDKIREMTLKRSSLTRKIEKIEKELNDKKEFLRSVQSLLNANDFQTFRKDLDYDSSISCYWTSYIRSREKTIYAFALETGETK